LHIGTLSTRAYNSNKAGNVPQQKRYLDEMLGVPLQDLWLDINTVQPQSAERSGYATQKPELLLERIINLASNEGDLIADFFAGRTQAGLNSFTLTPKKWISVTNAIGLISKTGRYGGTYAHKDIAFEFASWISVEFKLYLIKEFQRLKDEERKQLGWDIRRNLSNLENLNALFINENVSQNERLLKLNKIAIHQMKLLTEDSNITRIGGK